MHAQLLDLRHTELGAATLLTHPELGHRWTVAAYICDYRAGWTCEHLKVDDAMRYGMHQLQYWPGQRGRQTPEEDRLLSVRQVCLEILSSYGTSIYPLKHLPTRSFYRLRQT